RVKKHHGAITHLPKIARQMESRIRKLFSAARNGATVNGLIHEVVGEFLEEGKTDPSLKQELEWFRDELGDFKFALTRPYFDVPEKKQPDSGGLFSITINPNTCKGCMECVQVCNDDALRPVLQTTDSIARLRKEWDFWTDLPNTPDRFNRIDDLEEKIGPLETILLNKAAYLQFASGDGACL